VTPELVDEEALSTVIPEMLGLRGAEPSSRRYQTE